MKAATRRAGAVYAIRVLAKRLADAPATAWLEGEASEIGREILRLVDQL